MDSATYTVFYTNKGGNIIRKEYIGNDHEDALKQAMNEEDSFDVLLIFTGPVPEAIWVG